MATLVGKTLGKYRVVARLGKGGMAEVYKAFQPGLNRYVAVKVMHSHLSSDEDFVGRFQREALATGKLSHPSIVQAMDFDQAAGMYFMVMQYIDGPTLKDEIRARRRQGKSFSLPEISRIYFDLCDAIDYAHSRGMIHRDIKPANVMIDSDGQVLLTDFGIARLLEGTQYTATGAMTGTPAYMSPEQGRGRKVDSRSDIYTMGVILYELVTGKVPFEADTPIGTVMQHINAPLPPPRQINPNIPDAVEQVIIKAMAKNPDDRYQTGNALARALREAIGMAPGDTTRKNPLQISAPPPKPRDELDPTTGTFTAVGSQASTQPAAPSGPQMETRRVAGNNVTVAPAPRRKQSGLSPLLIGGMVAGLLVIVALGGFLVLALRPSAAEATPVVENTAATAEAAAAETAEAVAQLDASAATATADWLAGDNDRDNLTNGEELELGTDPDFRDTDRDGVDDFDEQNQYNTDPLNADTDGDSLNDGGEVRRGLDPLAGDTDGDGMLDASDPDPLNAPTPTPTETPLPAETPTLIPSATAPPTKEPTVTPTPTPQPARSVTLSAAPLGVFQDFESVSTWRRGDQANGEFTRASGQTHSGSYAGRLDYNFSTAGNDFVVFLQSRSLAGRPNAISAWVYGDGEGHFLNVWIKDNGGQSWTMSFGQIKHNGWQQMTAILDPDQPWPSGHISGPDNGQIDYPISFQALTLDDGNDGFTGRGTIYIDDITSQEGASAPQPTATASFGGSGGSGSTGSTTPAGTPGAASASFQLKRGSEFSYAQPWGAPRDGDVCQTLENGDWDDTQPIYRGLTVELLLTNNSGSPVPDDWGGVDYLTFNGVQGTFCQYKYPGSGPPPGDSRSVTYFAVIPIGDYVKAVRLNLSGETLEMCLGRQGGAC